MNKNTLIGGIVIIVLVVLGVWYFSSSKDAVTGEDGTATSTEVTGTTGTPKTPAAAAPAKTFRSIFTQAGNHQCSYEQVGDSTRSSSVIYLADGKMRGEFRTVAGNENTATLMIYDGGYLYSWTEGMTTGKRSSIRTLADLPQVIPNDLTSGAIFGVSDDNVSWDCHDWAKDAKFFTIPTYVKFST